MTNWLSPNPFGNPKGPDFSKPPTGWSVERVANVGHGGKEYRYWVARTPTGKYVHQRGDAIKLDKRSFHFSLKREALQAAWAAWDLYPSDEW